MHSRFTVWIFFALLVTFVACPAQDAAHYFSAPAIEEDFKGSLQKQEDYLEFVALMEYAGLGDLFARDVPFTVFLPAADALERMDTDEQVASGLMREHLTYHIVAGTFTASDLLLRLCSGEGEAQLTTVQGESLQLKMEGTDILLIDRRGNKARITRADIHNEGTVIHKVDRPLFFL